MSQQRAERLMNLHIMLLGARRFIPKDVIRRAHYGEHPMTPAGDEAFERAFERDKDALRAIGAAIEVGSSDPLFDDEVGYRIPTEQTSLPALRLEADEAAVLGVAAQVWEHATMARATERALTKLKALGIEIDPARLDVLPPAITADEEGFDALWDAIQKRRPVTFAHRRSGAPEATRRRLEPWGLVRSSGRWYVVGLDVDRGEERVFRLSRIEGPVKATGRPASYDVPAGVDVREVARRLAPDSPPVRAELLVRAGAGIALRRRAEIVSTGVPGPDATTAWDRLAVSSPADLLADEVLAHGADVVVESPSALREAVVARLRAVLGESA